MKTILLAVIAGISAVILARSIGPRIPESPVLVKIPAPNFPSWNQLLNIHERLENYTVFSPIWKVTEDRGAKIAEVRDLESFLPKSSATRPDNSLVSLRIRFTPYLYGTPAWANLERSSIIHVDDKGPVEWNIKVFEDHKSFRSALTIVCQDVRFEIEEISSDTRRLLTEAAINAIWTLCNKAIEYQNLGQIKIEFAHENNETEGILIEPGTGSGLYIVKGYVNPGIEGFILLRMFTKIDHKEISPMKSRRTLEYIGWSDNAKQKYYYESEVTVDGDKPSEEVSFEVWFQPCYRRKIVAVEKVVKMWTR